MFLGLRPSPYLGTGKEAIRMSVNLIDLVKSQLGGQVLSQVISLLGETPDKT
jgi:hypothetical protein